VNGYTKRKTKAAARGDGGSGKNAKGKVTCFTMPQAFNGPKGKQKPKNNAPGCSPQVVPKRKEQRDGLGGHQNIGHCKKDHCFRGSNRVKSMASGRANKGQAVDRDG